MPDAFVTMVTFQATGLDKIQSGLKAAQALQKSITTGAKQYTQELKQTTRQIEAMGRVFKGKEFRDRVRETDSLVRAQERLTKTMERQATLARLTSFSGAMGAAGRGLGMLGNVAGGVAAAGLGMGLAGMQGTVPMARFQNQMDRLQWELGNLLTPYLNIATKATAKAANWLGRQDVSTQNQLGGLMVGGAGLLGANLASKAAFGMGIGRLGLGVAGAGMEAGGMALGGAGAAFGAARMGGMGALAAGNMAYGMGGMRAVAGLAGAAIAPIAAPAAALTLGLGAANSTIRLNHIEQERQRIQGGDSMGFYGDYAKKFAGLSGDELQGAIHKERGSLLKAGAGISTKSYGFFGAIGDMFGGNTRETGRQQNANEARLLALAQLGGEKGKPALNHRGNAMVGGDFQEIGAGYYGAMSAAEKLRYDKSEGGGSGGRDSTTVLEDILTLLKDFVPGAAPQPNKQQQNLGRAIPNFG